MGCGASRVVQAIEEDPEKSPAPPDQQKQQQPEELTSVRSNTPDQPDQASRPVDPPSSGPVIQSNGTESSTPTLEDNLPQSPLERKAPNSGGTRAVAFEVGPPDASDSLIRRHPPRKFQRLEDQQQANTITQEQLEEKQATAERRRQEILTQRVQSAKHRSAMRMRPDNDDGDEVEKFMMTEELDWMSLVNTSLLPPIKHSTAPQSHHQNLSYVSSTSLRLSSFAT